MSRWKRALSTQARLVLAQSRADLRRMVASGLAIAIGSAFVVAAMSLTASSNRAVLEAVAVQYNSAAAVVTPGDDADDPVATRTALQTAEAVASQAGSATALDRGGQVTVSPVGSPPSLGKTMAVTSLTPDGPLRWERLVSGRLPTRAGEVAVSGPAGLSVGDTVDVTQILMGNIDPKQQDALVAHPLTVVGTLGIGSDPRGGVGALLYVTEYQAATLGLTYGHLRVAATRGASQEHTLEALRSALADTPATSTLDVVSGEEVARTVARTYTSRTVGVTAGLFVFVFVALSVSALVIANTFAVVLAQRVRELALLRCVGATGLQVAWSTTAEAAVVGLLFSALGALLGAGLAAATTVTLRRASTAIPLGAITIPGSGLVLAVVAGTVTCVLASLVAARAATRVRPLEALRPAAVVFVGRGGGRLRTAAGAALAVVTVSICVAAAAASLLPIVVLSGLCSMVSIVMLVQSYAAPMASSVGRLASRVGGVAPTLAAQGVRRHPGRTAACTLVLMIGITLTSAVLVGAASTRVTANGQLATTYPIDVTVTAGGPDFPGDVSTRLSALADVDTVTSLTVPAADGAGNPATIEMNGKAVNVRGTDLSTARAVSRATSTSTYPSAGQAVMPYEVADQLGVTDGTRALFEGPSGQVSLDVVLGSTVGGSVLLARDDLDALTRTRVREAWLRLDDGLDADSTERLVADVASAATAISPGAQIRADVAERLGLDGILASLLLVVTGLLAVSVLIALLGLGNTLALSAVERQQEFAVLRALGMTRGQLASVVVWEALFISVIAAALGCLLGVGYGLLGTRAALGELQVDVPILKLAALTASAVVASLTASAIPALRTAIGPVKGSWQGAR